MFKNNVSSDFFLNFLLVLGIVLLSATSLQIAHRSITPAVLILAVSSAMAFFCGYRWIPEVKLFLKLFAVLAICFSAGMLMNHWKLHHINPTSRHDLLAYLFAVWIIISLTCKRFDLNRCILISAILLPLFYFGFIYREASFYQHVRFAGLAVNPNQFGLALCGLPFILMYYYNQSSFVVKMLLLLSMCTTVMLGIASRTHALFVAWGVTILGYLVFLVLKHWYQKQRMIFWIALGLTAAVFICASFFILMHFNRSLHLLMLTQGEPHLRLRLWMTALKLVKQSPLVGFGPGSFLNMNSATGYLTDYEAHNVFVDLLLQAGFIGLVSYFGFLYCLGKKSIKQPLLMLTLIALIIFSCFHYVLRQPIVWIYFYWIYQQTLGSTIRVNNKDSSIPI